VQGRFGGARKPRWTSASAYSSGQPKKKKQRRGALPIFISVWGGAALLGTAYGAGWFESVGKTALFEGRTTGERVSFRYCFTGGGYNCVVDGDTIWLKGVKIRIADIDAPETHDPHCASEKVLGNRATSRLHDLLQSGPITLQPIDRDKDAYGRKLRLVLVNGTSVGDTLVREGLARYYGNGRRPWC
jgi:endonuclease YncB( thermonuclease family)